MDQEWAFVVIVVSLMFAPNMLESIAEYIYGVYQGITSGGMCALGNLPLPPVAQGYAHIIEDWCKGLMEISRRAHDMDEFNRIVRENESPINNVVVRLMKDMLNKTDRATYEKISSREWYHKSESLFRVAMYIISLLSRECDPICSLYRE